MLMISFARPSPAGVWTDDSSLMDTSQPSASYPVPPSNATLFQVNNSLRQKLKEAKDALADSEQALDERVRALKKLTSELHATKEDLVTAEERAEKLESTIADLKARLNVRKISAGSQVPRQTLLSLCFCPHGIEWNLCE